jgi:hypothetical protein
MAAAAHKFAVGQIVRVLPSPVTRDVRGNFKVVRILPTEHGVRQYRVKSETDGHERVVSEGQVG